MSKAYTLLSVTLVGGQLIVITQKVIRSSWECLSAWGYITSLKTVVSITIRTSTP